MRHKKKALKKDFRVEVKKSLNRFLSIFFIVAMGGAFYSGIQSAAPDMKMTGDSYFDHSSLMDIRVISTLGLTEDDLKAVGAVEGVAYAEGVYQEDVLCKEGEDRNVLRIESLPQGVNTPTAEAGTLPRKEGDCFLDSAYALEHGYEVGDTLQVIYSGDEEDSQLKRSSFTVCGYGNSPVYIAFERGNTTLGNGEISGFAYVLPEDFDSEVYSVAYVLVEGAKELQAYTDEYDEAVEEVFDRIEAIEDVRCEARYNEVMEEAESELEKGRQEVADGKQELEDAKQELADAESEAESELAEAESELLEGESELESGKQELEDAKQEVADGEKELADGEREIAENESELADGLEKLTDALQELNDGEAEWQSAWQKYQTESVSGQKELRDAQKKINENKKKIEEGLEAYNSSKKQLEDGEKQYNTGAAELEKAKKEYEAGREKLANGQKQYDAGAARLAEGQAEYDAGAAQLAEGQKQYRAGASQLAEGQAEYDAGIIQLEAAKQEQEAGAARLAEGQKEYEEGTEQLAAARQTYEAGAAALEQPQAEYDAGAALLAEGKAQYEAGLAQFEQSKAEYEAGEQALAEGRAEYEKGCQQVETLREQAVSLGNAVPGLQSQYESVISAQEQHQRELSDAQGQLEQQKQLLKNEDLSEDDRKNVEKQIEQLNGQIAELTTTIDTEQTQAAELLGQIQEAETQKQTLEVQAGELQQMLDGKKPELDASEQQLAAVKQQLDAAEAELQANGAEIEKQEAVLAAAKEQLDAGYAELAAGKEQIEASEQQLAAAREQLDAGYAELAAGEEQTKAAEQQLAAAKAELDKGYAELKTTKQQLDASEQQLAAAKKELDKGYQELDASKAELDEGYSQLAEAEKQITAGEKELDANKKKLVEGKQQLVEARETLESGEKELRKAQKQVDDGYQQLRSAQSQLNSARETLDLGWNEWNTSQMKLNDGQQQLSDARQELEDARKELEDARKQITDAEQEIAENEQKLADGWKDYEEGRKEADDKIAEAKQKIADAEKELADAEQEIADAEEEVAKIKYPEWYVYDRSALPENTGYGENAERMKNIGQVFPVLFFLVAALISLTTMTRMVEEERTQIGTLKALGYSKGAIASKYLKYAFYATLGGSLTGILIGEKFLPWVIIRAYGIMYQHLPEILVPYNWDLGLIATVAALFCTIGATLSACYRELQAVPATLMRPPAPKQGKRVLLEYLPFIWKPLSFSWKSTVRNLLRYKKRFLMTVIGIGGCMGLLLVGYGLRDSIMDVALLQFGDLQHYEAMVILDTGESDEKQQEVIDAVAQDERISFSRLTYMQKVSVKPGENQKSQKEWSAYLQVPQSLEGIEQFFTFRDRETQEIYELGDEGAIVTEKIANEFGLHAGDCILVEDEDKGTVSIPIARICENYLSHYIYVSPVLYQSLFGSEPEYNTVLMIADAEYVEALQKIGSEILEYDGALNVSYTYTLADQLDHMLTALDSVMIVLIISAGMLAFVVLYNLNNININERRRELATIKVLGFYDGEVAAYVYRENVLLTVIGAFLGIFIGKLLHAFVITTVEVDSCMFGRNIKLMSFVYGVLFTFAFSIIVNGVMYFKLKKIDMVESLKSIE